MGDRELLVSEPDAQDVARELLASIEANPALAGYWIAVRINEDGIWNISWLDDHKTHPNARSRGYTWRYYKAVSWMAIAEMAHAHASKF